MSYHGGASWLLRRLREDEEKPSVLLEILIRTSCPKGGLLGDWFAGSGAAGEACRLSGRRYIGCEIDPVMAERARSRLAALLPFGSGGAS